MSLRAQLDPKLVGETKAYTFDFSSQIGVGVTLSGPVCTSVVYSGTDAAPSGVISGAASAAGAIVTQKLTGGTVGVIYEITCTVTTSDSQTLVLVGYLAVIPKLP